MLNNIGLVNHAKTALREGWGYVWGAFGQFLDEATFQRMKRNYPEGVGRYESFIRSHWMGKRVADCSGLIKCYYWTDDNGKFKYNGSTDITADTMLSRAKEKGPINTLPEVPGILLHKKGHVGIYIGNGEVIEAMGTKYGVVQTKLSAGKWQNWSKCPYIEYVSAQVEKPTPATPAAPATNKEYIRTYQALCNQYGFRDEYNDKLDVDGDWGTLTNSTRPAIRKGSDMKNFVTFIQSLLELKGYDLGKYGPNKDGIDGDFGSKTDEAVRAFQAANGLKVDGIVGINTFRKLILG